MDRVDEACPLQQRRLPSERPAKAFPASAGRTRDLPRVAFVGGHDRVEREILAFGAELGIGVEVHDGHTGGNGKGRLIALMHRTDLVVLITGTNSHNGVLLAKREAAKAGARVHIVKACGAAAARALLAEIALREPDAVTRPTSALPAR
jgi:Uncharacterized protein conserved in bacteria (DUF2325)